MVIFASVRNRSSGKLKKLFNSGIELKFFWTIRLWWSSL